jgi:V/A-type H+-transporting ATPase subunit E
LAKLAERLQEVARRLLPRLRTADYLALFDWLVAELPPADWASVRVNPADGELAAAAFPATRLVVDPAIAGGLEVLAEEGRIQVTNTLEKRLERAWPGLLPALLGDLENHA